MVRWMFAFRSIEKQINAMLTAMTIFVVLAVLFNNFEESALSQNVFIISSILKWISISNVIYFLVHALILTKKWIDKKYK